MPEEGVRIEYVLIQDVCLWEYNMHALVEDVYALEHEVVHSWLEVHVLIMQVCMSSYMRACA